jgi:CheY-like chemotaxis protein
VYLPFENGARENRNGDMRSILIVDPDFDLAEQCRIYLRENGYTVQCAATISDSFSLISQYYFDLIILDVSFEQAEISHIYKRARARNRYTEFIVTTRQCWSPNLTKAFYYGSADYLTKPFHMKELLVKVERIMDSVMPVNTGPGEYGNSPSNVMDANGEEVFHESASTNELTEDKIDDPFLRWLSDCLREDFTESHFYRSMDIFVILLSETFHADRISILFQDCLSGKFILAGTRGLPIELKGRELPVVPGSVSSFVLSTKKCVLVEDIRKRTFKRCLSGCYRSDTCMSSPLHWQELLIGMVHVSEPRSRKPYTAVNLNRCTELSNIIVTTLNRLSNAL